MARTYPIQNNFNGGELSPRLTGRTDIGKYSAGALTIENFIVQAQGGIKHRMGSRFVLEVKNSANLTRLVPFVFSTVQGYMLEFSNNLIRFYKDEGNIESGGSPLELTTTYTTAQIPDLQFSQTEDELYITHEAHPTAKLTRTSDILWTLTDVDFQDGPYLDENVTTTTLNPAAQSGTGIAVVASSIVGINGGTGFQTTDIGRLLRLYHSAGSGHGWAEIVSRVDTTNITVDIKVNFTAATAVTTWRLGAFGSDTDIGYPRTIAFSEQRLWLGSNPGAPQTVYGSRTGFPEIFSPTDDDGITILDTSGINYTIFSDRVNVIRWMNPVRALLLGTSGGVWPVQASATFEAITPSNVQITRSSINGTAAIQPTNAENLAIYASATKRKILGVGYDDSEKAYKPEDLTLLADHITQSGIDALAFASEPHSVVWCVRNDGVLAALTYIRDQKIFGWHRHILGGSFGSGDAVVESVAVIPSPSGDPSSVGRTNIPHDQVWLIVKRTINGSTVRYVEFLEDDFSDTDVLADGFFLDSGFTYNSTATTTISSGIAHLEGETVQVIADGSVHPDRTVSSSSITLSRSSTKVHIGLYRNARMKTLNIDLPANTERQGAAQGRLKRIPRATLRFDRTLGGEICSNPDGTTFDPIFFRSAGDPMDAPPPLFTGDKLMLLDGGWSREAQVEIRQPQPLPFNLTAFIPALELSSR